MPARVGQRPQLRRCLNFTCRADNTTPADIKSAAASGFVVACKYYPAGATTNSAEGVTDVSKARASTRTQRCDSFGCWSAGEDAAARK